MQETIEQLQQRIRLLEQRLSTFASPGGGTTTNGTTEDVNKLKPIAIKDIEKPNKYDNTITKCATWYDGFTDLLANRHCDWEFALNVLEKNGKHIVVEGKGFLEQIGRC